MLMEFHKLRCLNSPCVPDDGVETILMSTKVKRDPRALKKAPKIRRAVAKYLISDFKLNIPND